MPFRCTSAFEQKSTIIGTKLHPSSVFPNNNVAIVEKQTKKFALYGEVCWNSNSGTALEFS
jgi:hypothetical protein